MLTIYFSNIGSDTVSHLRFCDNGSDVENELFWRGSNCLSKFEFSTIKEDSVEAQLQALGL